MSLAATLRPASLSFASPLNRVYGTTSDESASSKSFRHDSNYLALDRMLVRYQTLILLLPAPVTVVGGPEDSSLDLSPLQRRIQAELYSPLPYHRTKWLHNIQGARNLLLQLERQAQGIQVQRTKREILKDLSEKRSVIKKLRTRVEEIGRQVEGEDSNGNKHHDTSDDAELLGDRVEDILGDVLLLDKKQSRVGKGSTTRGERNGDLETGRPVRKVQEDDDDDDDDDGYEYDSGNTNHNPTKQHNELFDSSVRQRQGRRGQGQDHDQQQESDAHEGSRPKRSKTSGYSNLASTEKQLDSTSRTHEDLTSSLVSMAAQLKQQTKAFEFTLDQDKNLVDRALEGLDRNVSAMDLASRNMAFLRRMSEGEGLLGRLKLYAIIFAMWIFAVLLVFVGPKLRF